MYQKDGLRDPTETLAIRYCPCLFPWKGMRREYPNSILSVNAPVSAGLTGNPGNQFAIQHRKLKVECDRLLLADPCRKCLTPTHRHPALDSGFAWWRCHAGSDLIETARRSGAGRLVRQLLRSCGFGRPTGRHCKRFCLRRTRATGTRFFFPSLIRRRGVASLMAGS